MEDTITISMKEYLQLREDSSTLARLEAAGVDNWEGYASAFDDEDEDAWKLRVWTIGKATPVLSMTRMKTNEIRFK